MSFFNEITKYFLTKNDNLENNNIVDNYDFNKYNDKLKDKIDYKIFEIIFDTILKYNNCITGIEIKINNDKYIKEYINKLKENEQNIEMIDNINNEQENDNEQNEFIKFIITKTENNNYKFFYKNLYNIKNNQDINNFFNKFKNIKFDFLIKEFYYFKLIQSIKERDYKNKELIDNLVKFCEYHKYIKINNYIK